MSFFDLFKPGAIQPIIKSQTEDIDYLRLVDCDYKGPYELEVHVGQLLKSDRQAFLSSIVKYYDQGGWKRIGRPLTAVVKNKSREDAYQRQIFIRWGGDYTLIYELDEKSWKQMTQLVERYGSKKYVSVD